MEGFKIVFLFSLLLSLLGVPTALDIITPTLPIRDGESETIVSAGGSYELGFFSPGNSKSRYLGIWYKKISTTSRTIVWVANREVPLTDTSGVLTITHPGILFLINGTSGIVWSSNTTRTTKSPVGQLLESGNLVVKDSNNENPDSFVWQSFDYPCDTLLPGMKFGRNLITGLDRFLSSWKSTYDPAPGEFTARLDLHGFPQGFIIKGQKITNRIGPWDGAGFSGIPSGRTNPAKGYEFVMNDNEVYYKFSNPYGSTFARAVLNPSGVMQAYLWNDPNGWQFYLTMPIDQCDSYNLCGAYASCNIKRTPTCKCLEGFIPKSPNNWNKLDRIEGCIRRIPLAYNNTDGFRKYTGLNLPDTFSSWYNKIMSLEDCEELCLKNFSCVAYTNSNTSGGGSGCLLWFGSLIDMRIITDSLQDLYIRVAASELGSRNRGCRMDNINEDGEEDLELPVFDLNLIVNATHNFSNDKKLGEGGFGPVYRGALMDGQEIAVKRLSKNSGQGVVEFKNEVQLIAKLQHRNLVKLLGFCIQGDEKMLIYEFMPNKSLDFFIFDKTRSKLLTWHMRMNIVGGIARGLLYLHQDSRLRIIHRDIKTSNILLDKDMNPKISDFGMARTFWGDQIEENTERIVGT